MKQTQKFDLINSPLEGTNLIEASAGTGKTYTITGIFLRLVLEKALSVDQILVVTFTEAATEELKDRIRTKLRDAIIALLTGKSDDSTLNDLIQKYSDNKKAIETLKETVRDFDQAAIFTIHGFCKRMLHENAFESGSLFDTELVTDIENLKQEIVEDFWRRNFYHASPLFVNFAISKGFTPKNLLALVGNLVNQPELKVIPQIEMIDTNRQEQAYQAAFTRVRAAWEISRAEVEKILLEHEGLNRNKYRKASIPIWMASMDDYVNSGENNPSLFDKFERFTKYEIDRAIKNNSSIPNHPFFQLSQNLKEEYDELEKAFEQQILALKIELFKCVREELDKRKTEKNIQSFDDLLLKLHQALTGEGGEELAKSIRNKYKAALIDEFQDTDPIQYAIFKNIFETENNTLFLIGDPKQAIYGFRGADIFAYMDAARHTESRFTLGKNWRSEPDLITAINTIFENRDCPFVYQEIPYDRVEPADKANPEFLRFDQKSKPPLQVLVLDANKITGSNKPISKAAARELIARAVAAEISQILKLGTQGKALIGNNPLRESDIAVLVRRNAEALLMQQILSELNIPSVLYSTGSIFDSHEAIEMERVLAGIVDPNRDKSLKAALATDMLGISGEEIDDLIKNESGWENWLIKFREYHDLWNKRGFIRMFKHFLSEEKILSRLMSLPDGERRNTNVLHLIEILHQVSIEKKITPTELLKWLAEQRDSRSQRLDEHQLRLESDEKAVKLVTIHKSKGLEYPIVFCPFAWDGSRIRNSDTPFTFHDERDNRKLTFELGSENAEENRLFAEKELLAENLRLLYVALTRAKHRCYLVWGRINEAETSAPAYLFHYPESMESNNIVDAIGDRAKALTDTDVIGDVKSVANKANGTINVINMPLEPGEWYFPYEDKTVELRFKDFRGQVDRQWRISSFSSLVHKQPHASELADYDLVGFAAESEFEEKFMEEKPSGIFAFPGGRRAGICWHKIFEDLDFSTKDTKAIENVVSEELAEYGFEPEWQETVGIMVQNVISTALDHFRPDFTLSRIYNNERLNELEFYFPLKPISPKRLKSIFYDYGVTEVTENFPAQIERLNFMPVQGFMKGFIDLVFQFEDRFYMVDWKSNHLGNRIENYDQKSLKRAMEEHFYFLQYLIYTVALDQYLKVRLPNYSYDKHFGGVFYIFLRGVDPDKGSEYGIFRDRPSEKLIERLNSELLMFP